jgi:uncharacterized integral membrane protein (TIGR00698 family)
MDRTNRKHDLHGDTKEQSGFAMPLLLRTIIPGTALCLAVMLGAFALSGAETALMGRDWLEALVLAILIGALVRSLWTPPERFSAGIRFTAQYPIELAIPLLGATLDTKLVFAAGLPLVAGIAGVVALAIAASYFVGRGVGLSHRMALLVAAGNSICGNSAIAAVAPVIGADNDDVAASIAFTAVLGVATVLLLPVLAVLLGLTNLQFGVVAGLTVYAVPQVIAATAPIAFASVQMGTLVKLLRVLMLGPVMAAMALLGNGRADGRMSFTRFVPWFLIGFALAAAARSVGLVPDVAMAPIHGATTLLTVLSMAALGLGVDIRMLRRAGGRVALAAMLSLLVLGAMSLALVHMLAIA